MENARRGQDIETAEDYDLDSVDLPRLSGRLLALYVRLLNAPLTGRLLLGHMLRHTGISRLREQNLKETPLFQPCTPSDAPAVGLPPSPFSLTPALQASGFGHIGYSGLLDYNRAYRAGTTTPEAVAQRLLQAIADSDANHPPLRAFIACDREDVQRQAQSSSQRWREGKPLSPFDGVPVAIKDELDQMPYPTTLGTAFLNGTFTGEDASVVARLRAAGALLIGKTNMHEIGAGVTGLNPHHGTVRNPYHPEHHSGGSSSGSAAAVAAGLCPVAIGVDGGGSIRIPAAFCGVVGLKPTYGRISSFGGAAHGCSLCQPGPLAVTARDAALAYALIAGPDPRDPKSLDQPPVSLAGFGKPDLRGLTLGVYWPWFEHVTPSVLGVCKSLLQGLLECGAQVKEIRLPDLASARAAHAVTILAEMAAALEHLYPDHRRDFGLDVRVSLVLARSLSARDYLQAQRMRARLTEHLLQAWRQVDVIVSPTTGCGPPPVRRSAQRRGELDVGTLADIMRFAFPANLAGLPAISFPAGYDQQGLPIGFQAMGRPWKEHVLLRLAQVAEHITERRLSRLHYRVLTGS